MISNMSYGHNIVIQMTCHLCYIMYIICQVIQKQNVRLVTCHEYLTFILKGISYGYDICDWLWERDIFAHIFKIELKCTTRFVVKVTCCGVMTVSVHSFLFTQRSNSSRKR